MATIFRRMEGLPHCFCFIFENEIHFHPTRVSGHMFSHQNYVAGLILQCVKSAPRCSSSCSFQLAVWFGVPTLNLMMLNVILVPSDTIVDWGFRVKHPWARVSGLRTSCVT